MLACRYPNLSPAS